MSRIDAHDGASFCFRCSAFGNYFLQAQRVRNLIRRDLDGVFRSPNVLSSTSTSATPASTSTSDQVDLIVHPSAIRTAPLLTAARSPTSSSSIDSYLQDVFTVPASLAGIPSLSIPMPTTTSMNQPESENGSDGDDGWPVGVSLSGQWGSERLVMYVGRRLEERIRGESS